MPENKFQATIAAQTPAKSTVPESVKAELTAIAAAATPEVSKPKGPTQEEIELAQKVLQAAVAVQENKDPDFGPSKPGKKDWTVPKNNVPLHLGHVTFNTAEYIKDRRGKEMLVTKHIDFKPGTKHRLTYDEIQEVLFRMSKLVGNERVGRFGEGITRSAVVMNVTGSIEGSGVNFGSHGGHEAF